MTASVQSRRNKAIFKAVKLAMRYIILSFVAFFMLYPLLWLFGAAFRTNAEIFTSIGFWPISLIR